MKHYTLISSISPSLVMASNSRCLFFLLLALSFCFQVYARDSKFFSKVTKTTKVDHESISVSPIQAPTLAPSPSPEPEIVEHGYGLYGQDPYKNYQYPPTTTNPTKSTKFGEEKFVPAEELSKHKFKDEFEMAYSNNGNRNGNGNEDEKHGMSDTRFLENGKYYYDVNQEKDESSYLNKNENRNGYGNGNGNENERKGMSDTRFLENGKYYYDINEKGKNDHLNTFNNENEFENENENENEKENENENENENLEGKNFYGNNNEEVVKAGKNGHFEVNNNENENVNFEKQGMSDTRFLENGKYFYDGKNENGNNYNNNKNNNNNNNNNNEVVDVNFHNNNYHNNNNNNNNNGVQDVGFHNNNNVEYANSYYENGNGNGNEYVTENRGGSNYHRNEYHMTEGRGGYNGGSPKKFPNEYDTMEEYDREQGYIDGKDGYVP